MRIALPVDSRLADTAGLFFLDLSEGTKYFRPVRLSRRTSRNGYRGACLAAGRMYVCTSCEIHVLALEWPSNGEPRVEVLQTIARPEWLLGERANADLHSICHDARTDTLLVANSAMDAIDRLDLDGKLLQRSYLWDISKEIMGLGYARKPKIADLCHLNHIAYIGDRLVLTLANINGTRRGALVDGATGEFLMRDLRFPHDGCYDHSSFYILESDVGILSAFDDVARIGDIGNGPTRKVNILDVDSQNLENGRIWLRGITCAGNHLLVGCSQFHDISGKSANPIPSHLRIFDRANLQFQGSIFLPQVDEAPMPVLYSIVVLAGDAPSTEIAYGSFGLRAASYRCESLFDSEEPMHARQIQSALSRSPGLAQDIQAFHDGRVEFLLNGEFTGSIILADGIPLRSRDKENADPSGATTEITISYDAVFAGTGRPKATFLLDFDEGGQSSPPPGFALKDGSNTHRLLHMGRVTSLRMSVRLAGKGRITLQRLRVQQVVR